MAAAAKSSPSLQLGRQNSPEGDHEGNAAWETRRQAAAKGRQREPRAAQNEDDKGSQSLGDKTAATGKIFPPLLASFRPPPLASSAYFLQRPTGVF